MFRIFRIFTNLYAKLIASAAIGVLLVGGMILNAQWGNRSVARSHASSQNQNLVVKEVMLAQQDYLRGQIQRRNIVLAHNLPEAEKAFESLKTAGAGALAHAKTAAEHAVDDDNRALLSQFSDRLTEFQQISVQMATTHFDIVKLQQRQIQTALKWSKAIDTTLALPALKDSAEAQPRVRDAATSMLDTGVDYWRYAALQEPVVLGKMYQAADKVYIELQRARSATTDEKLIAAIDGLLAMTTEMNDIIDGTKQSFDTFLKLDRERNTPLRAQLEDLIGKISTAAEEIARRAEASLEGDMARSSRFGLAVGLFVML